MRAKPASSAAAPLSAPLFSKLSFRLTLLLTRLALLHPYKLRSRFYEALLVTSLPLSGAWKRRRVASVQLDRINRLLASLHPWWLGRHVDAEVLPLALCVEVLGN